MRLAIFEIVVMVLGLGLLVVTFVGNRPRPERFLKVNGLEPRPTDIEHVRVMLRRTYRSRLIGGLLGLAVGGITGAQLGTGVAVGGAGIGLLMGTSLGIALAQSRGAVIGSDSSRSALLIARDPDGYRSPHATGITMGLAVLLLAYGTLVIATADGGLGVTVVLFLVGFATALGVPVGRWLQRRTIEMRRDEGDIASVRVDDALRASAVRGIHHATVGVLMCGLLLIGYGAVGTQTFLGVKEGDHVLLRTPPLSRDLRSEGVSSSNADHVTVHWVEANGTAHTTVIRRNPGSTDTIYGNIWANGTLLGIGYWITIIGFVGALIQWGRAAKAWRRPQAQPASEVEAPAAAAKA